MTKRRIIEVKDMRTDKSKPGKASFINKSAPERLKTKSGKKGRYA